jgi:very-short-patch-repair endonuclease
MREVIFLPKSKYEEKVYEVLKEMFPYLSIAREHPLCIEGEKCEKKYKRMKIDFFIKELNLAIEVDGEHHFQRIEYESYEKSQSDFERRIVLDNLKEQKIYENGWGLIRFSYKELKSKNWKELVKNRILEYVKEED